MEKIDGIELNELTKEATASLLLDKRQDAIKAIKKLLYKYEGICQQIVTKKNELNKLQQQKEKAQNKIKEIQDGNWSALDTSNEKDL